MTKILPILSGCACLVFQVLFNHWLSTAFGATVINQMMILSSTFIFIGLSAHLSEKIDFSVRWVHLIFGLLCFILGLSFPSLPLWLGSHSLGSFSRFVLTFMTCALPMGLTGLLIPLFIRSLEGEVLKNDQLNRIYFRFHILAGLLIFLGEIGLFLLFGVKGCLIGIAFLLFAIGLLSSKLKIDHNERQLDYKKSDLKFVGISFLNGLCQFVILKASLHFYGPFPENFSALVATSLLSLSVVGYLQSRVFIKWESYKKYLNVGIVFSFLWLILISYLSQFINGGISDQGLFLIKILRGFLIFISFFPLYLVMGLLLPTFFEQDSRVYHTQYLALNSWFNGLGIICATFLVSLISLKLLIIGILILFCVISGFRIVSMSIAIIGILFFSILPGKYFHLSYRFFEDPETFSYHFNKISSFQSMSSWGAQVDILSLEKEKMLVIDGYKSVKLNQDGSFNKSEILLGSLQGYLGIDRNSALILGVGSGATVAGNAESYKKVIGVEIHPVILELQELFKTYNKNLLEKKNVELILDDGFSYLLGSSKKFDLITNNVPTPQYSVASQLWTREFLEIVDQHLSEKGFYSQWIDGAINQEAIIVILKTLQSAFNSCYFAVVTSTYGNLFCFKNPQESYYKRIESISNLRPYLIFPIPHFGELDFGTKVNSLNRPHLKSVLNPFLSQAWREKKDWFLLNLLKVNPENESHRAKHCMALKDVRHVKGGGLPGFCLKKDAQ